MFSSNDFNALLQQVLGQLGVDSVVPNKGKNNGNSNGCNTGSNNGSGIPQITPAKALVIAGLLSGVLEVDSVLVDRNQDIEIVLAGSLKRKTSLDKMMDQLGPLPFDTVMKALADRYL